MRYWLKFGGCVCWFVSVTWSYSDIKWLSVSSWLPSRHHLPDSRSLQTLLRPLDNLMCSDFMIYAMHDTAAIRIPVPCVCHRFPYQIFWLIWTSPSQSCDQRKSTLSWWSLLDWLDYGWVRQLIGGSRWEQLNENWGKFTTDDTIE